MSLVISEEMRDEAERNFLRRFKLTGLNVQQVSEAPNSKCAKRSRCTRSDASSRTCFPNRLSICLSVRPFVRLSCRTDCYMRRCEKN